MPNKHTIFLLIFCLIMSACAKSGFNVFSPSQADAEVREWLQTLRGKTIAEQIAIANETWADGKQPNNIRSRATYILASLYNEQSSVALQSLENQYKVENVSGKIAMEETLYGDVKKSTDQDLKQLLSNIRPEQESVFPYSLLIYESAKRNLLQNSNQIVTKLSSSIYFFSPVLTGKKPSQTTLKTPVVGQGAVAILLPRSGNIANISAKIIAGVEAAKGYLKSQNRDWEVHYIDTSQTSWIEKVRNLPKDCVTIGGPIQNVNYNLLKQYNLLNDRAIFAFVPRLTAPDEEGVVAWQFFTKPEDQINTMLDIASSKFGARAFGVFAPDNSYGKSMDNLFTQIATSQGFAVESGFYVQDDIKSWTKAARDFLRASVPDDNKTMPRVGANIDAIFFPAPWRDMDQLISTMHYQGAINKVMLGTLLWEQSLNGAQSINPKTFNLTMFPAAYEPSLETALHAEFKNLMFQMGIDANDWSALGFDFLMMASTLNLSPKMQATQINQQLKNLKYDAVSAPIYWDERGISYRELFVNKPDRTGRIPYNSDGTQQNNAQGSGASNQVPIQDPQSMEDVKGLIDEILAE